ncbi:MAG: hypothetical protein KKB59_19420 [Spirochaetes bacterium]|nr:hypothetical protein [Spirochaetota bacterium]
MGAMKGLLELDDKEYKTLKKAYLENINEEQFLVFGQPVLPGFAKYWIQALENQRKARGLSIYNPKVT